jgi:hypothetical protein
MQINYQLHIGIPSSPHFHVSQTFPITFLSFLSTSIPYIETSAITGDGISRAFETLLREIMRNKSLFTDRVGRRRKKKRFLTKIFFFFFSRYQVVKMGWLKKQRSRDQKKW